MIWIILVLIVGLAVFVGYNYVKNRITNFVSRYQKVDLPPGYKLVSVSDELYIIESPEGKQEIVYFEKTQGGQ